MKELKQSIIETPLGEMLAIGDEEALYLLEFADCKKTAKKIDHLLVKLQANIVSGTAESLDLIETELKSYFKGSLKEFKTPIKLVGSSFQNKVWNSLMQIPFGTTRSYRDIACTTGNIQAFRAAANANGANKLAIIIPCHRVINSNGQLGGYAGGIFRKKYLLQHESELINAF